MFLKVKKALEILTNETSRKAFDDKLQARILRKKRRDEMDSKTRQMKDDLITRENKAKRQKREETNAKKATESKLNQLREEGRKKMEEQEQKRAEDFAKRQKLHEASNELAIRIKWKVKKVNYTLAELENIFKVYGKVDVALGKKPGRAVAIYYDYNNAVC